MLTERLQIELDNVNGYAGLTVDGQFKGYFGGSFEAVRAVGATSRHPADWGDARWVAVGAVGVHHATALQPA